MTYSSTLTQKAQVVIPKPIRDKIGLRSHDKVIFGIENGRIIMQKAPTLAQMKGFLSGIRKKPLSQNEMDIVIAEAVVEKHTR